MFLDLLLNVLILLMSAKCQGTHDEVLSIVSSGKHSIGKANLGVHGMKQMPR